MDASPPVCLIRPPATESFRLIATSTTLPLGLAYIAGAIEASGRPVQVIDAVAQAPTRRTRYYKGYLVGRRLEEIPPQVPNDCRIVGITVIFTPEWPAVVRLIELLKAARPDLMVIVGGEHVTSMPEFCLATSQADVLVLGEGEETIVELLDALEGGRSLEGIPGLVWRDAEGRAAVNPRRRRREDVDDIPWPAWHLFDIATYQRHGFIGGLDVGSTTMPILATRGCPYQCTYCSSPNMWTTRWIPRNPARVVDEIEFYLRRYGAQNFPFQDLTAVLHREWIIAFCQEILARGLKISWQLPTGTRLEAVDEEVATLLRRSGVVSIAYSPETGSDTIRRWIKKRMDSGKLVESIRASAAAGLTVSIAQVIGFPHDTPELLEENLPFLRRMAEIGVEDAAVFYYMALPGTELFHSLYDAGRLKIDRAYFTHIFHGLALWPSVSYNERLGRWDLARWKLRMVLAFYGAQRRHQKTDGPLRLIWKALAELLSREHHSRLRSAVRGGLRSLWTTLRVRFRRGWLPARAERSLFADWDRIYRGIRSQLQEQAILSPSPTDTRELHRANVIPRLRRDHESARRVAIPAS